MKTLKPIPSFLVAFVAALALLPTQQAQAGYWANDHVEFDGQHVHQDDNYPDRVVPWGGRYGFGGSGDHQVSPSGVGGFTNGSGRVRFWYRWVRRTTYVQQPGGGYSYGPDPNDNPPESLVVSLYGGGYSTAISDYQNGRTNPGPNRMQSKEHASVSALGETAQGVDVDGVTKAELNLTQLRSIPAKGKMETDAQGDEVLAGPWLPLSAIASLDGGRYANQTQNSSGNPILGRVASGYGLSTEPQTYYAVSPDPLGLALMPCPDPTPQPPLNQYVMQGDGGVFKVPCSVAYIGSNSTCSC